MGSAVERKSAKSIVLEMLKKERGHQKDMNKKDKTCKYYPFFCEHIGHSTAGDKMCDDVGWRKQKFVITDSGSEDLVYIKGELTKVWSYLYKIQEQAEALRKTYLEELAIYKSEMAGTSAGLEIKKLIYIEEVRKTARKHGWYLKDRRKGTFDHVLIPYFMASIRYLSK